jgi:hypothetical protein
MPSTTREFHLSDEMKGLLNVTRAHVEGNVLFVENAKVEPVTCLYTDELISTVDALKQALTKTNEFDEKSIDKFLRLFADVWCKQEDEPPPECKSVTVANAVSIRSTAAVVPWTSACIADQLLMDLCRKETTLSADILEDLSKKQTFDSGRRVFVLKYRTEFLHVAHLISATDYRCFPAFRIDPRDLCARVLKEILDVDRETQNMIMMDVINRILRSSNKLLYLEHIQPNGRHLLWKWEEFDLDPGSGPIDDFFHGNRI